MKDITYVFFMILTVFSVVMLSGCDASDRRGKNIDSETSSDFFAIDNSTNSVKSTGDSSIEGVVNLALLNHHSCTGRNAVYLFKGLNVSPDDINGFRIDPMDSTPVKFDYSSKHYNYHFSSLKAGDYTLAFSCQEMGYDDKVDNNANFLGISSVKVSAGTKIIKHIFPL